MLLNASGCLDALTAPEVARCIASSMVCPSTKWLPITRMACRMAARTAGMPTRRASWATMPSGVSPAWMMRAETPSAQAEACTRNVSDFAS